MKANPLFHRRGLVTLLGIACLGFVSVALVALSRLSVQDIRRTGEERSKAQLRLLLRAAEQKVEFDLARGKPPADFTLPLPVDCVDAAVAAKAKSVGERYEIELTAVGRGATARETLTIESDGRAWHVTEYALGR